MLIPLRYLSFQNAYLFNRKPQPNPHRHIFSLSNCNKTFTFLTFSPDYRHLSSSGHPSLPFKIRRSKSVGCLLFVGESLGGVNIHMYIRSKHTFAKRLLSRSRVHTQACVIMNCPSCIVVTVVVLCHCHCPESSEDSPPSHRFGHRNFISQQ